MRFRVFWEASYLPWQNPGGLFALGNLRSACLVVWVGLGPGGPLCVDVVAGGIRRLVRAGGPWW